MICNHKNPSVARVPIPYDLSDGFDNKVIQYRCKNCGTPFFVYGRDELFCHICGSKVDWEAVPTHCSEDFRLKYDFITHNEKISNYQKGNRLNKLFFEEFKDLFGCTEEETEENENEDLEEE